MAEIRAVSEIRAITVLLPEGVRKSALFVQSLGAPCSLRVCKIDYCSLRLCVKLTTAPFVCIKLTTAPSVCVKLTTAPSVCVKLTTAPSICVQLTTAPSGGEKVCLVCAEPGRPQSRDPGAGCLHHSPPEEQGI
jgi:hypothetical protein